MALDKSKILIKSAWVYKIVQEILTELELIVDIALRILVFDVYESEKLAVSVDLPPNFLRSCKAHEQTAADFCTGALLCAPTDGGLRVAL